MENLLKSLDKLLKHKNEDPALFYTLLSNFQLQDNNENYFREIFLPNVYYLYNKQVLRKDLIYLSLLASQNYNILDKFIDYDKSVFILNIEDPASLYDYYIYKKRHWLYELIDKPSAYDSVIPLKDIYNKLNMIKFIKMTNELDVNLEQLKALASQIDEHYLDEFWKYYIMSVNRHIDIIEYCKTNSPGNDDTYTILRNASTKCLLETLSTFMNLNDSTKWISITDTFQHYGELNQLNIFTTFTIIASLIHLLIQNHYTAMKTDFVNKFIEELKMKMLELSDKELQMSLLENLFCLLFYRNRNDFQCKEKEIRLLLYILKSVTDELILKKKYEKKSEVYKRLTTLNIYLTDAVWRLDLIVNLKLTPKIEDQLISYMLAPPDSLIHLCLKRENFERAYQVIEIFNLRDADITHEVTNAEKHLHFKKKLKHRDKIKQPITKLVDDFFKTNTLELRNQISDELVKKFEIISHFENIKFMNLFDLAISESKSKEDSIDLLKLAQSNCTLNRKISSNYLKFYDKIIDITEEIADASVADILISSNYQLDVNKHRIKEDFYETLKVLYDDFNENAKSNKPGILNKNHPNHKIILKINEICKNFIEKVFNEKESTPYILKVFNYLKAFSKILYIEKNSSDIISNGRNSSYFQLFNFNRSELTGKLLFERQLDPSEFEKYFGKLKLDFLYHVVGNCFPTINLHMQENVTIEELYHDNMLYTPSRSIIIYIQKRNWLLAFILNEMYKVEDVKIDISEIRLQTFFNYLKLPRIQYLKLLFEKNDIITALQNCISAQKVKLYLQEQIVDQDLVSVNSENSNNSNEGFETGEEILEDTKTTNWKNLYDIIESVPEKQMMKKSELINLKNNILINLIQDAFEPDYYKYTLFITNRDLRIDTILNNFKKWPGHFVLDIIKAEITRFDALQDSKMEILRDWLKKIETNEQIKNILDLSSWYKSYEFCKNHPHAALEKILQAYDVQALLSFIKLYKPTEEILYSVDLNYLTKIMDLDAPLVAIKDLLDSLPFTHTIDVCHHLLKFLRKFEYLQFVANYLDNNVSDDIFLKNVQVSLKMLSNFTETEQDQLFCLINEPLNILEVLIMNTKLDKLAIILDLLNLNSPFNDYSPDVISTEKIDELLRIYAEKSLDFRVITHPNPRLLKTPEHKLMQSLDSLSVICDRKQFMMPENVPTKDEWVQNDEVLECMCCRQITFSMFNRRHHCRRCGRVVCYNCSLKRMLVQTYGDILVRVCSDCYDQTIGFSWSSEKSDIPSTRSLVQEYWLLNDDPEHNKIVREEFSYEHAPSTSLCFSILKFHSKTVEYPKFLLKQCEVMLKLLKPTQEPTHEIDYLLVIKMMKSLAIAAKMLSTEHMLNSGTSLADRILSQAELLALLAERECLHLMPLVGSQNLYVDATILRRLRDKLLQREQWNLALEVSTKAGLDNTGVFAAWGKSCLKAGSLLLARDKFQRCLDKNSQYDAISNISRISDLNKSVDSINVDKSLRFSSRVSCSSLNTESKPIKDPPLLHEIIQILETKTRPIHPKILEDSQRIKISSSISSLNQISYTMQSDTALSILSRIKNLKEIASGNYSLTTNTRNSSYITKPRIDPIFYDECVYYLHKYGTYTSLLEFYIKHGDMNTALLYIIKNKLNCDIFVEIYMKCLKDGIVNILQEHMSRIDSSLDLWKNYLKHTCRHLEQQQLLNCLYQLQLYIGDYVRASMTCIRFYQDNVKNFTELANNVNHLHKCEEHLRQVLEQEQWVEVSSVGKVSNESKESFEEHMLSNPDLIMKIETKDVNKHIHTVKRQIEIVNFLSQCESTGANTREILKNLINSSNEKIMVPTLFGSNIEKTTLAAMIIICGETVDLGFDLATKIIQDFKLRPIKVYCMVGKQFAQAERYNGITQLVNSIKSTGINDLSISDMLDEMLTQAVGTLIKANVSGTKVEDLIKLIKDRATKITAYIEAKQLKTAYFLAVKYKRTADIRRIQREAELLNMPTIKALCQKVLQNYSQISTSHSKDS